MSVLAGDVNANKTVNNTDVGLVKAQVTVPVDATNFRNDVNASGTINNTDGGITKANVSAQLP
jgi:Dockerin type I domain